MAGLDSIVSEIIGTVRSQPKLAFQLILCTLILLLSNSVLDFNPYIVVAQKIAESSDTIGADTAYIVISLIFFLFSLTIYTIILSYLYRLLRKNFLNSLKSIDLKKVDEMLNRLYNSCLIKDSKLNWKLTIVSGIILLPYYLALTSLIYFIDSVIGKTFGIRPFIIIASIPLFYTIASFALILVLFALKANERTLLNEGSKLRNEESHAEWLHYLLEQYITTNCIASHSGESSIVSFLTRLFAPISILTFNAGIIVTPPRMLRWRLISDRFKDAINGKNSAYKIELAGKEEVKDIFKRLEEDIGLEDISKGINHFLNIARLFKCDNFVGLIFFFSIKYIDILKPPLRPLSHYRGVYSTRPEESFVFITALGRPEVESFIQWLILAIPKEECERQF